MTRLGLLVAALLGLAVAHATTVSALTLEELIAKTELAAFGVVESVSVEARNGEPWTVVSLSVTRALRGEIGATLSLAFYGGTLDDGLSISVAEMPSFTVGDQVLFLAYDAPYYSPLVGFNQGLWRLTPLGLTDVSGRLLSLDEDGNVTLGGQGGDTEAILTALAALLEARP